MLDEAGCFDNENERGRLCVAVGLTVVGAVFLFCVCGWNESSLAGPGGSLPLMLNASLRCRSNTSRSLSDRLLPLALP